MYDVMLDVMYDGTRIKDPISTSRKFCILPLVTLFSQLLSSEVCWQETPNIGPGCVFKDSYTRINYLETDKQKDAILGINW